jgi:prepilin-type N-terminal cleavage/methylation domain-containing protein
MRENGFMKNQRGFTLIEVVISIAVLFALSIAIYGYFEWSHRVFNHVDTRATAESLARSQMESIKAQTYNGTGTYIPISSPHVPPYTVSGNVSGNPTLFGTAVPSVDGLQRITIIVTRTYFVRPGDQRTETVTLEGYKEDRR